MCWNKGRLCWKIAKLFYFCHLRKLVRPETFGPYHVQYPFLSVHSLNPYTTIQAFSLSRSYRSSKWLADGCLNSTYMSSPTVGKAKCSYVLSEMSYVCAVKTPKTFGVRTDLCEIRGHSSLKPKKNPGSSRKTVTILRQLAYLTTIWAAKISVLNL